MLALIGSATVPDGFMRVSGPDGVRLILCTSAGVQEVLLTDAGEVIALSDAEPGHRAPISHDGSACVPISVAGAPTPPHPVELAGVLLRLDVSFGMAGQWSGATKPAKRHPTRAPPVPV